MAALSLASLGLAGAVAPPAFASDFSPRPYVRSWTGCYIGANIGYADADGKTTDAPFVGSIGPSWTTNGPPYDVIDTGGSGVIGGGELGCDYQFWGGGYEASGVNLVVGIAGDISALDVSGSGTSRVGPDTHASVSADWVSSLRLRGGFASESVFLYATGGFAWADISTRAFDLDTSTTLDMMSVSGGGTEDGWVIGGGLEFLFAPSWSLSVEYLHFEFDSITASGEAIVPVGAFPRFVSDVELDVVRAGIKLRM